tara:strand:+ start:830 stop:1000 length:171 start_codon:yes stop_codon:yes gene_type:complete
MKNRETLELIITKLNTAMKSPDISIQEYVSLKRECDKYCLELAEVKLGGTGYAKYG